VTFTDFMDHVARFFEVVGAGVLVGGLGLAAWLAWAAWRRSGSGHTGYEVLRASFGGAVLLALEILVAADLLRTVAVAPTLENVGVLALIVVIRTFLSFSLEIEIEGVVPWKRALVSGATHLRGAMEKASAAGRDPGIGSGTERDGGSAP
jgi:uncharacterized membrane protein